MQQQTTTTNTNKNNKKYIWRGLALTHTGGGGGLVYPLRSKTPRDFKRRLRFCGGNGGLHWNQPSLTT